MAAPVVARKFSLQFRDSKGETARLSVLIGAATIADVDGHLTGLVADMAALSNAHVESNVDSSKPITLGTTAQFASVEDKAVLVFKDLAGRLHRYQVPAPIAAAFNTDLETVKATQTAVANVLADFAAYVYGAATDTAPLAYVGGIRVRRKLHRKTNIITLDPTLTIPEE